MLKALSEEEKQEIRETIKQWCKAAKATAERDPEFKEHLIHTPFWDLVENQIKENNRMAQND